MWIRFLTLSIVFFLLALLQASFFSHLAIMGVSPNLIFSAFFVIIFFEKPGQYYEGFFAVIVAGFFLDALSPFYFGLSMISLLGAYILNKVMAYFLKEQQDRYVIILFIVMFLISFAAYSVLHTILVFLLSKAWDVTISALSIQSVYNLVAALLGFYIYKNHHNPWNHKQLKLFK